MSPQIAAFFGVPHPQVTPPPQVAPVPQIEPEIPRNGGKRAGAGRKTKEEYGEPDPVTGQTDFQIYTSGRARKEIALAVKAEIEAELLVKTVVLLNAVEESTAETMAVCSQALDSIPDVLERELQLEPAVCVKIRDLIDRAKMDLCNSLRKIGRGELELKQR